MRIDSFITLVRCLIFKEEIALLVEKDATKAASDHGDGIEEEVELRHRSIDPKEEDGKRHNDANDVRPFEIQD